MAFLLFIAPTIIGFYSAVSVEKDIFGRFYRNVFGISPVNAFPKSWDRKFCYQRKPCYLIVTIKDGSSVAGYYGSNSFSSSEPAERDVFIEQVYDVHKGVWQEDRSGHGILIMQSEIRYIEFFSGERNYDGKETPSPAAASGDSEILQPGCAGQG